jgi:adenosylcobinamide-GDP ribazoletransferase
MSKANAIKTFRDLLSFLTIIPLAKTEDFVITSADHMYLFPIIGALIGLFAAAYFQALFFLVSYVLPFVDNVFKFIPAALVLRIVPAATTLAFLLVLTGLQHFDGLVDLGNAIGLSKEEDRRAIAHVWTVTHKGAVLAIAVEIGAFAGLFLLNANFAFKAIIAAEISAKLAMVTIAWIGKPAYKGLGSRFIKSVHMRRRHIAAYALSVIVLVPLLGLTGVWVVLLSVLCGVVMERIGKQVFGGVSGDMIGATNEATRAVTLLVLASVFML